MLNPAPGNFICGNGDIPLRYVSTARIALGSAELIIELTATGIDPA
jgi:hypothetical protein